MTLSNTKTLSLIFLNHQNLFLFILINNWYFIFSKSWPPSAAKTTHSSCPHDPSPYLELPCDLGPHPSFLSTTALALFFLPCASTAAACGERGDGGCRESSWLLVGVRRLRDEIAVEGERWGWGFGGGGMIWILRGRNMRMFEVKLIDFFEVWQLKHYSLLDACNL